MSQNSSFHKLIDSLRASFTALGKPLTTKELESTSILIYELMSGYDRKYHRVEHVLEISSNASPLETIAIFFHDLVYIQVDKKIHRSLEAFLYGFSIGADYTLSIPDFELTNKKGHNQAANGDPAGLVIALFGFSQGQRISLKEGLNEFLSAIVATRLLKLHLDTVSLVQIVCCIEATIPFRSKDELGESSSHALAKRLTQLNDDLSLNLTQEQQIKMIQSSVEVANRDVGGFAANDPGYFMSQTWKLILETHPIFNEELFSNYDYRTALQQIESFHQTLDLRSIFKQYQSSPPYFEYQSLISKAEQNRAIQIQYIQAQLVTLGLFEAISGSTGGPAPFLLFTNDYLEFASETSESQSTESNESQEIKLLTAHSKNFMVYHLLKFGKTSNSSYQLQRFPVGAYLYQAIHQNAFAQIMALTNQYFDKTLTSEEYLKQFSPRSVLVHILKNLSVAVPTRKDGILSLLKNLSKD